jgi:UDP-galactopyranose mutase
MTLYQVFGAKTPDDAKQCVYRDTIPIQNPTNFRDYCLSTIGGTLYELFIYGYIKKKWGREPSALPIDIIDKPIIKYSFDDNAIDDIYQGIPRHGYTEMVRNMLDGVEVEIGVDYLKDRARLNNMAKMIVYSGPIDKFFNYCRGKLEYRSINYVDKVLDCENWQGGPVINYTSEKILHTRVIEHKHFSKFKSDKTIITEEYPVKYNYENEPYYPINDFKNNAIYEEYSELAKDQPSVIFGGRLGTYRHLTMDQTINQAISKWELVNE